jgi:hypothetical protein
VDHDRAAAPANEFLSSQFGRLARWIVTYPLTTVVANDPVVEGVVRIS